MIEQEETLAPDYSEQAQSRNTTSFSAFPSAPFPVSVTYTTTGGAAFSRPWNSDSNAGSSPPHPNVQSYSSLDMEHVKILLLAVEGISARLTQLENRIHRLENSVDDLKGSFGNNHHSTDGELRQSKNILQEVQDVVEAQLRLAKLHVSKTDQQSETQTSVVTDPSPVNIPQSIPAVLPPNAPPQPPTQQGLSHPLQLPNQFSQNQILAAPQRDPYFPPPPPPVQSQEVPNQQYQRPLTQQHQRPLTQQPHPQPGAPLHQQYQQTPHPQYSQPAPHLPQQQPSHYPVNLPQLQSSLGHHAEETPYAPSQNYPPNLRRPTSQPLGGPPLSQQYYNAPPHTYEPPSSRPGSGYSFGYGTLPVPAEPYRYGGSSQYGGTSALKPPQLPTASLVAPSGGSGYPHLPAARVLPQAPPTASAARWGSGSTGTGSRVPIDDVVDKVASMGFPRDHVRATVWQLTENGQPIDLNTVLDKLMNAGEVQAF